jgi:hypothetical protein
MDLTIAYTLALKEGMDEYSFAGVDDFGEVLSRLVMHAQNLNSGLVCTGASERVLRSGESAEDLAMSILLKFLDPWTPLWLGLSRKASRPETRLSRI